MPIGTVDYVSTAPWNDPFNPWPAYTTIPMVSSFYIQPVTLKLSEFNPTENLENTPGACIKYSGDSNVAVCLLYQEGIGNSWDGRWVITRDEDVSYAFPDTGEYESPFKRDLPAKLAGAAYAWGNENDGYVETLQISAPDLNSLTPWERRRRWNLMG